MMEHLLERVCHLHRWADETPSHRAGLIGMDIRYRMVKIPAIEVAAMAFWMDRVHAMGHRPFDLHSPD